MDAIAVAAGLPDRDVPLARPGTTGGAGAGDGPARGPASAPEAPSPPPAATPPGAGRRGGRPLRWHLLGSAAVLLVPVLGFAVGVAVEYGGAQRARLEGEARAAARELDAAVDRELSTLLAAAQTLAASPALKARHIAAFERQALEVATERGVAIVLRAPSGRQLVNTAAPRGTPLPERTREGANEEAARATGNGGFYVSNLFEGATTRRPFLRVVAAAHVVEDGSAAGEPGHGQIDVAFEPERLRRVLAEVALPPGWIASVVDRNGLILARTRGHDTFVGTPATPNYLANTGGHSGVFRGTTVEGVTSLAAYARTSLGDWRVAVGVPLAVLEAPLRESLWWLGASGVGLTALAASLALALARRIEEAVGALAGAAADLGAGRAVTPMPATAVREVNAVAEALAAAGAELRARIEGERAARQEARRELLQAVIDGSSEPIVARGLDGRFVLANNAGAALLGAASPAAALRRHVSELLPADRAAAVLAMDRAVIADGAPRTVEHRAIGADGRDRFFACTASLWRDADGRVAGVVCVSRDETARRAAEARLGEVRAELLRASRLGAVGAMAAGLSHELNQPLGAAANFLAAAEAMLGLAGAGDAGAVPAGRLCPAPDLDGARDALADGARQVLRAGEIVRRLRNFVAQGDSDMRAEEVGPLVAEACAAVLPPCPAAGGDGAVGLRLRVAADAGSALVDRVQIQQVVINLVRNAAEALRGGGDAAAARGGISVFVRRAAAGGCEVSVADTGPGIAPEVRSRLFEPFAGTKQDGMGIGLAICRAIVEAHGGRLWAEPNPGGGAVFRFVLPPPLTLAGGHDDDGSA